MILPIQSITSAVSKITEFAGSEKAVPGVLLRISENLVKVCYFDGHKAVTEPIECRTEEGDVMGDVVLDYGRLCGALSNCQPSGRIVVDDIQLKFKEGNTVMLVAEQKCLIESETEESVYKVMAVKQMELKWSEVTSSLRTTILGRMNYDDIFSAAITDEWEIEELVDILGRTSTEKAKIIYMSPAIQKVFVANLAHVTAVPVTPLEVSPMDIEILRNQLETEGKEDQLEEEKKKLYNKMKFPATISTVTAKQVCGILNKVGKGEKVYTHVENGHLSIFTADESIGIWVEMSEGSKVQTTQFEKFSSMTYDSYQMNFVREFLADAVKSAIAATNSEKLTFSFDVNDGGETELLITASNANASVNDNYTVVTEDCIDAIGDISDRQLKVSLKVFNDMLAQLKSDIVGMDISMMEDGSCCVRLAEIDMSKVSEEYYGARERLGLTDIEPTPEEEKMKYRVNTLGACQYAMLAK